MKIYVVTGQDSYESAKILCAFDDKALADACVALLEAHDAKHRAVRLPDDGSYATMHENTRREVAARQAFPATEHGSFDSYESVETELTTS